MSERADRLRELAEAVRGITPPLVVLDEALSMPPPEGSPAQLRAVADDFRRCARTLDDVSVEVDAIRREQLPDAWGGDEAEAAERRLRQIARYAETCGEVMDNVKRCLEDLASYLDSAQRRDTEARERIHTAIGIAPTASDDQLESLRSWYAVSFEEMAGALDFSEEAGTDAAARLNGYADRTGGSLVGADLAPVAGTPPYTKSQQDLDSLPPELIEHAFTYAERFDIPVELLVALLMQEQPFYAGAPGPAQWAAEEAIERAGDAGLGSGGDASVGVVQMKPPTAQRILEEAGYGTYDVDYLRNRLSGDDEFAVAMAALHLRLDLDSGMTERQAYLAYAVDNETGDRLTRAGDPVMREYPALSERSARYDANMRVINQAGDLREYFGIQ